MTFSRLSHGAGRMSFFAKTSAISGGNSFLHCENIITEFSPFTASVGGIIPGI